MTTPQLTESSRCSLPAVIYRCFQCRWGLENNRLLRDARSRSTFCSCGTDWINILTEGWGAAFTDGKMKPNRSIEIGTSEQRPRRTVVFQEVNEYIQLQWVIRTSARHFMDPTLFDISAARKPDKLCSLFFLSFFLFQSYTSNHIHTMMDLQVISRSHPEGYSQASFPFLLAFSRELCNTDLIKLRFF